MPAWRKSSSNTRARLRQIAAQRGFPGESDRGSLDRFSLWREEINENLANSCVNWQAI
jgi:hypothetical protein